MTKIDRSKLVLVFKEHNSNKFHCNVCEGYNGNVHGRCPCTSEYRAETCVANNLRPHPPKFNNIKYVPIVIHGYPCKGKQYNLCNEKSCDACVIVKRGIVYRGDNI